MLPSQPKILPLTVADDSDFSVPEDLWTLPLFGISALLYQHTPMKPECWIPICVADTVHTSLCV